MGSANVAVAEAFVRSIVASHDASHDWWHIHRVRNAALSLAQAEGITSPEDLEVVHLAALLHDVADHKYCTSDAEAKASQAALERFVYGELKGLWVQQRHAILHIVASLGYSQELAQRQRQQQQRPQQSRGSTADSADQLQQLSYSTASPLPNLQLLLAVVQDADRLDAIGAIGIARCLTFGGARGRALHDPSVPPRDPAALTKEAYQDRGVQQTTINHFYEKLLRLRDLMRTNAGRRAADRRHAYMEGFLQQFMDEWAGSS